MTFLFLSNGEMPQRTNKFKQKGITIGEATLKWIQPEWEQALEKDENEPW